MTDYKSQYNQDKFCYENFLCHVPHKGFFVEVGASDGVTFSNTFFYEKKLGWTGLCIEPRKKAFPKLLNSRDCFCENVGIAPEEQDNVPFLELSGYGQGMSGIISNYHPRHKQIIDNNIKVDVKNKGSEIITIPTIPLQKLLDKYVFPHIHFLSVDTEGGELNILKTIDWNRTTIDVITVENNYENPRYFESFLEEKGFRKVNKLNIDEIYVHKSFLNSINKKLEQKISFVSNWADNDKLQKQYSATLPNKKNWKRLFPSQTIEESDIIVVMDDVKDENIYTSSKKVIVFPREPPEINSNKKYIKYNLPYGFTYDNINHCVPQFNFLNVSIDQLDKLEYKKSLTVSCIVSGKRHTSGAYKRLAFVEKLHQKYPNLIDIYGRGLSIGKGELKSKMEGLVPYTYSLCMENSQHNNYFTEKFTDAIVCWTIPIYWGCPNISKYFPKGSYYWIDIEASNAIEQFNEIINKPVNIKALTHARNLVLSQYNVWNMIENVINRK